jgi:hypothetical protein
LNIVLDEALEEKAGGEKVRIGMVVIRGNAVVMIEVCIHFYLSLWAEGEGGGKKRVRWMEWQKRLKGREGRGEGGRVVHSGIEPC